MSIFWSTLVSSSSASSGANESMFREGGEREKNRFLFNDNNDDDDNDQKEELHSRFSLSLIRSLLPEECSSLVYSLLIIESYSKTHSHLLENPDKFLFIDIYYSSSLDEAEKRKKRIFAVISLSLSPSPSANSSSSSSSSSWREEEMILMIGLFFVIFLKRRVFFHRNN